MPFSTHHQKAPVFHKLSKGPQNLAATRCFQPDPCARSMKACGAEQHQQTGREKGPIKSSYGNPSPSDGSWPQYVLFRAPIMARGECKEGEDGAGRPGVSASSTYLPEATLKTVRNQSLNYWKPDPSLHVVSFLILPASAF